MRQFLDRLLYYFFSLLPIHRNNFLFISYYGTQYGCNPKYLSEYIAKYKSSWKIVWAFTEPQKYKNRYFKTIKYNSPIYIYYLCTCRVLVTNFRMPISYHRRQKQIYLQTWHSSLRLKKIEQDAEDMLPTHYIAMAKHDSEQISYIISGCKYSSKIFEKSFWYNGSVFKTGTPRMDLFFDRSINKSKILDRLHINKENRIILYAPTFRENHSLEHYSIQYETILKTLEQKYNIHWKFLLRLHPHLRNVSSEIIKNNPELIDVTEYDDIQELIYVADFVVSDYSSLIFDCAIAHKPCILYTPDYADYIKTNRSLYFQLNELPFPICKTNEDLIVSIINFDQNGYRERTDTFCKKIDSYETGNASCNVIKCLERLI